MSTRDIEVRGGAIDASLRRQTQELACSSTLHDQALEKQACADSGQIQRELSRLHADAPQTQNSALGAAERPPRLLGKPIQKHQKA